MENYQLGNVAKEKIKDEKSVCPCNFLQHLQVIIVKAQLQLCSNPLVAISALGGKEKTHTEKEIRPARKKKQEYLHAKKNH
jgi:hypothetical protein